MKRAYTLNELMVTLAIGILLTAISLPTLYTGYKDSLFHGFVSELTGHLILARSHALIAETAVRLDFSENEHALYECSALEKDGWTSVSFRAAAHGYPGTIRNRLPNQALPHPTTGAPLKRALSSTHRPAVVFAPDGSSSATVVFSDNEGRSVCLVVSGNTGRFRVFTHKQGAVGWKAWF